MSKTATAKDVIYALQFRKEQLVRHANLSWGQKKPTAWSLEPSGIKVPARIGDAARHDPHIVPVSSSRDGQVRFSWVVAE